MSGTVHTRRQKSMECVNSVLGDANLWNDLGFSLCAALSVCYVVTTSDDWMKSKMEVSADLVCYH